MLSRSWLGALGLRGRIAGAVLVTAVVTLVVAAIVLLPRLESSLRRSAQQTLSHNLSAAAVRPLTHLTLTALPAGLQGTQYYATALHELAALQSKEDELAGQVGATSVIMVGYIDTSGHGAPLLNRDRAQVQFIDPVAVADAWLSGRTVLGIATIAGTPYAFEAIPILRSDAVLWVSKSINEIPGAVHTVRVAFLLAALAALALTFLLAIPLSATVVRRLQRLRQAALRLAADGATGELPEAGAVAEMRVDRGRDEVGDLARTFALMQKRLQRQEAARRAFVATASHELRTPLASLDAMLELIHEDLKRDQVDVEDAQVLLERARLQTRRLSGLASDLLDLSRIDAGVQIRSEAVELAELGRAVLAEFELGAHERGVAFALNEPEGPVWGLGDPGSIAQILRILIDNSLRVAPNASEIEVQIGAEPEPSLSVVDHGPGVPDDEREMIFERFKRGRSTGGEAGFGLGLAIGRELAERMGGALVLAPSRGNGAMFTLTLPAARAPVHDTVPSAAQL